MVKIIQDFIENNAINRPGKIKEKLYITVHETANKSIGANARAHANYLKNITNYVSWHYTVDDKEIYQHLTDNEMAYHCTDGISDNSGNVTSIGIEICVNKDGDFIKAVNNTIELIAKLMTDYDIPIENVVPHSYWYKLKTCPYNILMGKYKYGDITLDWDYFIQLIKIKNSDIIDNDYQNADEAIEKLVSLNIINTPDYWIEKVKEIKFLGLLFNKIKNII